MIGVLLVNVGTPDSPQPKDVYRYLIQFLLDKRIIDMPRIQREFLVRGVIVPFRYKQSAKSYQKIWTPEGSPLLTNTKKLAKAVQDELGSDFVVEIAMRYGNPSIKSALTKLGSHVPDSIIVIPLFPQYASATTGSILEEVFTELQTWRLIPNIQTVSSFHRHPLFIEAWAQIAKNYVLTEYDHIIFSYHGLPVSQKQNAFSYQAECIATTESLVKRLQIPKASYTLCFQSRLGRKKWLEPYTTEVIRERRKLGDTRLLVFSPSFVSDCLETLYELEIEAKEEFLAMHGTHLDLVPSLNTHPSWVQALSAIIRQS